MINMRSGALALVFGVGLAGAALAQTVAPQGSGATGAMGVGSGVSSMQGGQTKASGTTTTTGESTANTAPNNSDASGLTTGSSTLSSGHIANGALVPPKPAGK